MPGTVLSLEILEDIKMNILKEITGAVICCLHNSLYYTLKHMIINIRSRENRDQKRVCLKKVDFERLRTSGHLSDPWRSWAFWQS